MGSAPTLAYTFTWMPEKKRSAYAVLGKGCQVPRVTYVPSFEIVLTRRCAYACGYCNFTNQPSPLPPSHKNLQRQLRLAAQLGACQVTLSAGEGIEELPEIHRVSRYYGYSTWFDYLAGVVKGIVEAKNVLPLVPVLDVGALGFVELQKMREFLPALRLMLDTADDSLQFQLAHREAPQKRLAARCRAIETAGQIGIPVITGILVGIGESPKSWALAAEQVAKLQDKYQHIQQFSVVPFSPAPRTPMETMPPPTQETYLQACRDVNSILKGHVRVVAEVQGRFELVEALLDLGIEDLGEIRLGDSDRIDTEISSVLQVLADQLGKKGWQLCPRPTLVNGVVRRRLLSPAVMDLLRRQKVSRARMSLQQQHRSATAS